MSYKYKRTKEFRKNYDALPEHQKQAVKRKWELFKKDPFHRSLGTHRIHGLSARARHTIYSVVIEADLRAIFRIDGDVITSLDIGTHDIYR